MHFRLKAIFGGTILVCLVTIVYIGFGADIVQRTLHFDVNNDAKHFEDNANKHFSENSLPCNERTYLVYRCNSNCGGWGDRQKGIISSFLLALLTNRSFIIDIRSPCDVLNHLDPNMYDWTRCKEYVNELSSGDKNVIRLGKNDKRIAALRNTRNDKAWTKIAIVLEVSSYPKVMKVIRQHPDTPRQLCLIENYTDYEAIGFVLRSLFKPKPELQNHLNNFIKENTQGRQIVCGHLRMGRNPNIPNEDLYLKPMNDTAMYSFLDQFKDVEKYIIYLASDSDLVRDHARNVFQNYINLNRKIVHIDRFDHLNSSVACDGFYTTLFEQYLLVQCDYLIIGRSNFAAMAAYIRGLSKGLYLYHNKGRFISASLADIQTLYRFQ